VLEERRQLRGLGAQHDEQRLAHDFGSPAGDQAEEWAIADAHQLFRGAEAR
jgi:hypothetical protein